MAKRVEGRSDRLLECAFSEFMEMGYQEASLRVIAAKAETTTGSIYTRFKDKEGLFHALVDSTVEELIAWHEREQSAFAQKPSNEQREEVLTYAPELWEQMVDYIYAHWNTFRMLARCADIDCYDSMLNRLVEIEVKYTHSFLESTENNAVKRGRLTPMLIHMLSNAWYSGLFEIVRHDMSHRDALAYVRQLRRFFLRGWADLLDIEPD